MVKSKYGLMAVLVLLIAAQGISYGDDAAINKTSDETYISELISRSKELKLADDIYWRTIVHYKKNLFGGYTSQVDDPAFFFAEEGKDDPQAELEATIRGFFRPHDKVIMHPTAKFSARYGWLKEKLAIDTAKLPYDGDTWFREFYKEINPSTVTLVFPAGFMNNPASMYGHTLLLIETEGGSRLMARSLNYAAATDDALMPMFVYKGLFGLYKGYYSFLPYYQKIREYSDTEQRDLWEYEISMTPVEKEKMVRHVIEMENIYADYYFIDENCSYNLLFLIEAAKPETAITDYFWWGVEPIDTLRAAQDKNIVKKRIFRPSLYSKIQFFRSKLNSDEQEFVYNFCYGESDLSGIDTLTTEEEKKIIMCDLAIDYLKFMAVKKKISEADYRTRFMAVLKIRNLLGKYDPVKEIPTPVAPDDSHESRKLAFETGHSLEGIYSQFTYRQSCHELMDPDDGYNMNSQIVFGKLEARYYYEKKRFVLQKLDVVDLISLPPSDSYFINPCYIFRTGLIQNINEEEKETLSYRLNGAAGLSTLLTSKVQVYFFAGVRSYFNPDYDNYTDLLGGGEAGILTILGPWKNHIYASAYRAPFGEIHTRYSAGLSERIKITSSVSILGDYSYNQDYSFNWHEFSAKVNLYF